LGVVPEALRARFKASAVVSEALKVVSEASEVVSEASQVVPEASELERAPLFLLGEEFSHRGAEGTEKGGKRIGSDSILCLPLRALCALR
jgi:hypothetical protein